MRSFFRFAILFATLSLFIGITQAEPIRPLLADARLADDYLHAGSEIRGLIQAHEREFPGAFRYPYIYYYTSLGRLAAIHKGLVSEITTHPKYQADMAAREPLTDFKVTAKHAYRFGDGENLKVKEWPKFKKYLASDIHSRQNLRDLVRTYEADVIQEFRLFGVRSFRRTRRLMARYVIVASLVDSLPENASPETLRERIQGLDAGALDYLKDPRHYQPYFAHMQPMFTAVEKDVFFGRMESYLTWSLEEIEDYIYKKKLSVNLKVGDFIRIREVHPNLGILRGFVGNDCASLISPGFVFTPYDRYYYVFDETGKGLGYVGLSHVRIDNEPVLYLHTIQGPDFTVEQTQLVLRGFQKAAHELGAERVVLGSDKNINDNVNFPLITRTMTASVAEQRRESVTWLDRDYRKVIVKWDSEIDYDDPSANQYGRALTFDTSDVEIEIQRHPLILEFGASCETLLASAPISEGPQ